MPRPWVSASVNSRRDTLMRDYLAIPSLYYDSTDKLFVVPEGRRKDYVAFQAGLRRRTEDGGRLESRQTLQRKDTIVLSLSLSLCPLFLSLSLCVSSIRFISRRVGTNSAGQRSHGIFTATTRVTSTDCITEETSRAEMLTRYSLRNPTSTDMRGIYELQTMFVPYHASSQAFEQL